MRRTLSAALLSLALIFSAGCIDGTQKITLNPDGSGKSEMEIYLAMPARPGTQPSDADAKDFARQMLIGLAFNDPRGIEIWRNVSYEVMEDGRIHFKGTAYFPDIKEYPLLNQIEGSWTQSPAGGMSFALHLQEEKQHAPLSDIKLDQLVKQVRAQWNEHKTRMAGSAIKFKVEATFLLPGKVDDASPELKQVPGGVKLSFDGKKFIEKYDKLVSDDDTLRSRLKSSKLEGVYDDDLETAVFYEMLIDPAGDFHAHVTGDLAPQFDYKAELAAARREQFEMFKKFGLGPISPMNPKLPPKDKEQK